MNFSSLLDRFYNSCSKVFVRQFQHLCHLSIVIYYLSVPMQVDVCLVIYVQSTFELCPGHLIIML